MSVTIDQQFVEYVVKSLVEHPDAVVVDRRVDEKGVLLELTVHAEDLGRVIGKRGATAQSIRTLLRALGTKQEARFNLKIVDVDRLDENGQPMERPRREESPMGQDAQTGSDDSNPTPVAAADDDTDDTKDSSRSSDAVARTRAELADLDDLDI
ncbi:KH domain-containing protein [Candidatus Saccharibacteria bacterium]|jgi:predicted RNA-binding protein YlqC (UPF0109 family)|nr:KH domain-containing protein [Candidatus Saccharibacteria bacterium]HPR09432.1 KH domain-containing protein [Candidatus Saccharibacteria bacterium]